MANKLKVSYIILHVIIPILISMFIYLFLRSQNLVFWNYLKTHDLYNIINSVRIEFENIATPPQWLLYNLPDALWYYSFVSFLLVLWHDYKSKKVLQIIKITLLLLPLLLEYSQKFGIIDGTFDFIDLAAYYLAAFISLYINHLYNIKNKTV